MKLITSRDNALLKRLRKLLTSALARREDNATVLDGPHLVRAYLDRHPGDGMEIVVSESRVSNEEIAALINRAGPMRTSQVPDALFKALSPADHPVGIVAVVTIPAPSAAGDESGDCLLLEGVQDPGNLGALLRTACAAGFGRVHLSPGCADAWSPKALRGGMGAQFELFIEEGADLLAMVQRFPGMSLACDGHAGESLYDLPWHSPLAVLVGAEGAGLSAALRAAATCRCHIPMLGGIESLNVATAAAVVMYEQVRRRARMAS